MLVHASKQILAKNGKLAPETEYIHCLRLKNKLPNILKIPNNGVAIVEDGSIRVKTYPWKKLAKEYMERINGK